MHFALFLALQLFLGAFVGLGDLVVGNFDLTGEIARLKTHHTHFKFRIDLVEIPFAL